MPKKEYPLLELQYSYIGDPVPTLQKVLDDFGRQNNLHIELRQLDWDNAWHELMLWSLYGQGPDISHIGSTWVSSLIGMNSLRLFTPDEIRQAGGEYVFLPSCWQSGVWPDKTKVWSLPWQGYTFLLAYRRDLLQKAGIDEKTAFQSAKSLGETVAKLNGKISASSWVVPVSPKHLDTLHYIASWVWGAGGDFFTHDDRHVAFLEPAALDAVCSYFGLMRSMKPVTLPLDELGAMDIFLDGKAAVTIVGSGIAYEWLRNGQMRPEMREKVGFVPIPGTPWVGGDNIIIWKTGRISPERERAAVTLAEHLVSLETQRAMAQAEDVALPTRAEAFNALPLQNTPLTNSIIYSLRVGRAYRPMGLWSKIEFQSAQVFGQIGAEILAGSDVKATVHKHLNIHADWLEIILR
jgi:ABC-type glycerol-3-phosphate transport system substrate-binding protein